MFSTNNIALKFGTVLVAFLAFAWPQANLLSTVTKKQLENGEFETSLGKNIDADPYKPADAFGKLVYGVEKFFGTDKPTVLAQLQIKCDEGSFLECRELGNIKFKDQQFFAAENYFQLACRYQDVSSCRSFEKLKDKRLDFEKELVRKKEDFFLGVKKETDASSFHLLLRYELLRGRSYCDEVRY